MSNVRRNHISTTLLASTVALAAGLAACDSGPEVIAYRSDISSPKTVSIIDTATRAELLRVDVPPGQQLNLRFDKARKDAEIDGKDTLKWSLKPWGKSTLTGGSEMQVPPASGRRIEVSLRKSGETHPGKPDGTK